MQKPNDKRDTYDTIFNKQKTWYGLLSFAVNSWGEIDIIGN